MTSPLSVSDFAYLAEKAYNLYNRLNAAKGQYSSLANSVSILHDILDQTAVHLGAETEGLTTAPRKKKDALVLARLGCENVLDEVEALLKKYPTLGSKASTSILERLAFIAKDIKTLEKSLEFNGNNLQRCLTALTSVSLLKVQKALDKIAEDIRNGKREKTVLSEAVFEHKRVDIPDAVRDAESALMAEEVHPDAIDLYRGHVKDWVMKTIAEEEAEPVFTRREDPGTSAFASPRLGSGSTPRSPVAAEDDDEDLYGSSQIAGPSLRRQPTGDNGRLALLRSPSEGPSSRRSSIASHRSKPDTWHPSNEPYAEYVSSMLTKAFTIDPVEQKIDIDNVTFYFKRAFYQQDCYNRGSLTCPEVTTMCRDAVSKIDATADTQHIARLVHEGDHDKDGRLAVDEFLTIMHNVLEYTSSYVALKSLDTFHRLGRIAEEIARKKRQNEPTLSLPWGFLRRPEMPYYDEVEMTEVSQRPTLLPPWSFSVMANDVASYCVGVLDRLDREWSRVLPDGTLRNKFRDTFDKVRGAAVRFTNFFNFFDEASLSDLDEMMTALYWLKTGDPGNDIGPQGYLDELHTIQLTCYSLAQHIKGFVFRLEFREPHDFTGQSASAPPSTMNFTNDHAKWKEANMDAWANLIAFEAAKIWPKIDGTVRKSRDWYRQLGAPRSNDISSRKFASRDRQSFSMLSSRSQGAEKNALNLQALEIAREYCRLERDEEQKQIDALRAGGRSCRLTSIRFERSPKKSIFSTVTKLVLEIKAYEGQNFKSLWKPPQGFLKAGSLPDICFTLPASTTHMCLIIYEQYAPSSGRVTQTMTISELQSQVFHAWPSDHGSFEFSVIMDDDPAKDFKRAPFPWLQYVEDVYGTANEPNGPPEFNA